MSTAIVIIIFSLVFTSLFLFILYIQYKYLYQSSKKLAEYYELKYNEYYSRYINSIKEINILELKKANDTLKNIRDNN